MTNHLCYGDNLAVLRDSIATKSADLIYLDPPFNSNASLNVLFKGPSGNDSAVQLPARRDDAFKKAARESKPDSQGRLDL